MTGLSLLLVLFLISVCTTCIVFPTLGQEKEADEVYTIKQGDTLWDISAHFLKDPFLWPRLWQRNPYITNPHWIYPGNPLRLAPIEEVKKEPPQEVIAEKPKEVITEPEIKKEEVPPPPVAVKEEEPKIVLEKPAEMKPVGWPDIRSAGFISDVELQGIGIVLESKEGKNLMSEGDIVYLTFKSAEPVLVGNKYTTIRVSEPLAHPFTNKRIGRKYNVTGNLQVIDQQGHFYTAKIIESFQEIQRGDMIQPYSKATMEGEEKKD